jgi:hypothetical protein
MTDRIAIAVHVTENVPAQVYLNHVSMVATWSRRMHDVEFTFLGTSRVKNADARNILARKAIEAGCTHWFSMDSDHIFREDALPRLWASRGDSAIISGLICKRAYPYETVVMRFLPDGRYELVVTPEDSGVREVDGCAFGCTLLNLGVMQTLKKPWFFDMQNGRSDINYCRMVKVTGHRILVDTGVHVGHLLDPAAVWPGESAQLLREKEVSLCDR